MAAPVHPLQAQGPPPAQALCPLTHSLISPTFPLSLATKSLKSRGIPDLAPLKDPIEKQIKRQIETGTFPEKN